MMRLIDLQKKWRALILEDDFPFSDILARVKSNSTIAKDIIVLGSSYNKLRKRGIISTIKLEDFNIERNKIVSGLLDLIDTIEQIDLVAENQEIPAYITEEEAIHLIKKEIKSNNELLNKSNWNSFQVPEKINKETDPVRTNLITNKVLVLTSDIGKPFIKSYINPQNYSNAFFTNWKEVDFLFDNTKGVEIIIINNKDNSMDYQKLAALINRTDCLFIYFGTQPLDRSFIEENNAKERFSFSNSIFTLNTRIKEMVDFINMYKV